MRNFPDPHHEQNPQEATDIGKNLENDKADLPISIPPEDGIGNRERELREITSIRYFIDNSPEPEANTHQLSTEVVLIDGKRYHVTYVPKKDIYPLFGYASGNEAVVREDLSPMVRRFVKAHELYHCQDTATWGGWFGREIRANIIPGMKDPLGLFATFWATIADKDRIKFYIDRFKRGY